MHLGTLVAAVPVLAWVNRDQWFAGDEWQVVTTNGLGSNPSRRELFAPHFEHWSTLGVLVYKALYGVFALRSYVPYVAVLFARDPGRGPPVVASPAAHRRRAVVRHGRRCAHDDAGGRMGEPVDRVADDGHRARWRWGSARCWCMPERGPLAATRSRRRRAAAGRR